MGFELIGSRVLAPYFGNSIFVWGALISVFLIALSAGYYLGGMLADRKPSKAVLGVILMLSGIIIATLPYIFPMINSAIFEIDFGYKLNPLAASLILFLLPGIGMGMVSPFVIKLKTKSLESVGNISGKVFGISTSGSILGTLSTAFFIIPAWGTKANLRGLGIILLICGLILIPKNLLNRHERLDSRSFTS